MTVDAGGVVSARKLRSTFILNPVSGKASMRARRRERVEQFIAQHRLDAALVIGYVAFVGYVAAVIVAVMAGRWLMRKAQPAWAERPLLPLAVGLILYIVVTAIPWLGTLVGLLVILLALGALWDWGRAMIQRQRPRPTPVVGLQPA